MMQCPDLFGFFEVRASSADWQTGWTAFKQGRPSQTPMGTPTVIDVTTPTVPVAVVQPKTNHPSESPASAVSRTLWMTTAKSKPPDYEVD